MTESEKKFEGDGYLTHAATASLIARAEATAQMLTVNSIK
jgi:hypothetical protein